ncbi:MAG: hypothetical protein JRH15_15010 [Deltaproteobacteria bacterium]|nr:hypothetical protein [Deltaproteobacteria bacterium]
MIDALQSLKSARSEMEEFLSFHDRLHAVMLQGGGIALERIDGISGAEAVRRLREEINLMVVPGHFFEAPQGFRVSWTQGVENTQRGLLQFDRWMSTL